MLDQYECLFTDGGNVGVNPSRTGGTWAWVWTFSLDGEVICRDSGLVLPLHLGLPTVTNNVAELLAAVLALEAVPDNFPGTLYTDSQITHWRIDPTYRKPKYAGVPDFLRLRCLAQRHRHPALRVALLGGHPTVDELRAKRRRDGKLVHRRNVECDEACQAVSRDYLEGRLAAPVTAP